VSRPVQALSGQNHAFVNKLRVAPKNALGLDAGGTHTRWAVVGASGVLHAQGEAPPLSGLQLHSAEGRAEAQATLQTIATAAGRVYAVVAGVTGFDGSQTPWLCNMLAATMRVDIAGVQAMTDIELACHAAGDGYVVYAGTGSIAAFIDAKGELQRVGGRGAIIDDAGGGHWIAREALRRIWRAEDDCPGTWRDSPMATKLLQQMGGTEWTHTRNWVYGATRGELGTLALGVAATAGEDPAAMSLLMQAGTELARLVQALIRRHGPRTVVLAGRVFNLHPAVEIALRQELPPDTPVRRLGLPAHHAAAQIAASRAETRHKR
jgi:glucosamine kinase